MASQRASAARLVLVTAGSERQALGIARTLVEERLAACVNVVGRVRSVYRWREAVEEAREYLLIIKTRAVLYPRVEQRVRKLHTYEVPEILSIALDQGHQAYVKWLFDSTAISIRRGARS